MHYRKIWEEQNGPIPLDKDGRPYEIHHIDGDRSNNDVTNLLCVSIQEHYDIHFSQGDLGACYKIANRMTQDPFLIHELASANAKQLNARMLAEGTHPFLDSESQRRKQTVKLEKGVHHFQNPEWQRQKSRKSVEDGNHNFLGGEIQRRSRKSKEYRCPHCAFVGKGGTMKRWHFDKCKSLGV